MNEVQLKHRVQARSHLVEDAEDAARSLREQALQSLARGDIGSAEAAIRHSDDNLGALVENLRVYQAELLAQADELGASQQRTDQALQRFVALFSALPVATLLVNHQGEVLDHNRKARELFALQSRHGGRFVQRLVDTEHYQKRVRPAFHEARAVGSALCEAVDFTTEDQRRFRGELHLAALPVAEGGELQYACAIIDRSAQLQAEQARREAVDALSASEALLASSAHVARVGGWEYFTQSGELRWTQETRLLHGVSPDFQPDLAGALAFLSGPSQAQFSSALEGARQGRPFDLELDMRTLQGQTLRLRAVGQPLGGEGPSRVGGVLQDVTAQHEAQRAISELGERLDMAHQAAGIGVWDWLAQDDIVIADARMAEMLDHESPGQGGLEALFAPALDDASRATFGQALADTRERGVPLDVEFELAGGGRWLRICGRGQPDAQGRVSRVVGCAWDTSAGHRSARLQAAHDAAEAASRAKSAFLSRMSHELRTPLNAILGFAQLMSMEAAGGDLTLKPHRLQFIETAARHLLELINEVLDVSRIEAGQLEIRSEPVDLRQLLDECLPLVHGQAEAAGIEVQAGLGGVTASQPLWAMADRLRLKEVVINLLSNAVKYNRAAGRVWFEARQADGRVALSIHDTGKGLQAAGLAELFQPFNRIGAEHTRIEGTGMGLFVSKRFIELMGGTIRVDSVPDEGSCFTVELPAAPPATA